MNRQFILIAPELQDPDDLNTNLCRFLIQLKKKDGTDYEPVTIRNIVGSIARYLNERRYENIMESPNFRDMREVLKRKMKESKETGHGNGPRTASALTDEEVRSLWNAGVFTSTTPLGLISILYFYMTLNFGMHSGQEHRDLKWGDVTLQKDHNGTEFLVYSERQTKTRTGENPRDQRKCTPQLWAQPQLNEKDPVAIYKKYASKRPAEAMTHESPFYLSVIYRQKYDEHKPWFKNTPVGRNTLQSIVKKCASEAGIVGKNHVTNHSARKTMIQTLRNAGLKAENIMEKSGHKNVSSILNYSVITDEEQRRMGAVLSGAGDPMFEQHCVPAPPVTYNNCTIFYQSRVVPWPVSSKGDVLKDLFGSVALDNQQAE